MLRSLIGQGARNENGAVASTVALSLFGLIAVGGLAIDYSRMAALDTELQQAADQAALAAVTQLDQKDTSCTRAVAAARLLITNQTKFGNDGGGLNVAIANQTTTTTNCGTGPIVFYSAYTSNSSNAPTTDPLAAKFVSVTVATRQAVYALTPIMALYNSGNLSGTAVAGLASAICKVPPVMLCNPDEPVGTPNEDLVFNAVKGLGLLLFSGNATLPGNFGWLDTSIDTGGSGGANALKGALAYNTPPGDCLNGDSVTTKTGLTKSALDSINPRFDIYANGNSSCPNNPGGTCSPSQNTRKDLVCDTQNASSTSCKSSPGWGPSPNPYRPTSVAALPSNGSADPDIMGYPRDLCHAVTKASQTCTNKGTGTWDRNAYFRVNYGWTTQSAWTAGTGLPATASRYDVYSWELNNPTVSGGSGSRGIAVPQRLAGNRTGFGNPATGTAGLTPGGNVVDRRRISVAVLNCRNLSFNGKTSGLKPPLWMDVFLVEPIANRGSFTSDTEIYAEVIGPTTSGGGATAGQVIRRDKPYLIE